MMWTHWPYRMVSIRGLNNYLLAFEHYAAAVQGGPPGTVWKAAKPRYPQRAAAFEAATRHLGTQQRELLALLSHEPLQLSHAGGRV